MPDKDWKDWLKHILEEIKTVREDQRTIAEEQKVISQTLTTNTVSLQEHMRRTELLENSISQIHDERKEAFSRYEDRIKPLEEQRLYIEAYWKLAALVLGIVCSEAFVTAWKFIAEFVQK
jgi:excinuclease UvrABC helicase subunit UvrB